MVNDGNRGQVALMNNLSMSRGCIGFPMRTLTHIIYGYLLIIFLFYNIHLFNLDLLYNSIRREKQMKSSLNCQKYPFAIIMILSTNTRTSVICVMLNHIHTRNREK